MAEYFEFTLFVNKYLSKTDLCVDAGSLVRELSSSEFLNKMRLFKGKKILYDIYEELDFFEISISIPDVKLVRKESQEINELYRMAEYCFSLSNEIMFITCIYELTGYYTSNVHCIGDITSDILSNFPIILSKTNDLCGLIAKRKVGNIYVLYNKSAQKIY